MQAHLLEGVEHRFNIIGGYMERMKFQVRKPTVPFSEESLRPLDGALKRWK
jgi:hypothetical protein